MKRSYLPQKVEEMLEKLGDGEKEILLLSSYITPIIILPVLGIIWGCSGSEKVELSKEGKLVEKMAEATYEVINSWEQLLKTMEMSTVWDLGYGLKDMIEYQIKNGGSGEKLFKELSDSTTPIGSTYRMAVDNMARGFLASDV
ncbi:MAG: hypothetical protein ABIL23_07650, partial [candidate division WOR-3 bacterium]